MFGTQFEPAFTRWPVMVAPGNHERDWPGTGDAFGGLSTDSGEGGRRRRPLPAARVRSPGSALPAAHMLQAALAARTRPTPPACTRAHTAGGECGVAVTRRYVTPASYPGLSPRTAYYSFNVRRGGGILRPAAQRAACATHPLCARHTRRQRLRKHKAPPPPAPCAARQRSLSFAGFGNPLSPGLAAARVCRR